MKTKPKLLTTTEAAELLGVTPYHVRRLVRRGLLRYRTVAAKDRKGRTYQEEYVLTRSDVLDYSRKRRHPGRPKLSA